MPAEVATALADAGAREAYDERPPYQRNDYIGWIQQAKTEYTRLRRISQMLDELDRGGVYMGMQHAPSRKNAS
jgi:uncharacterized protein YdeI (YjbR/CyaY-like superfamily)